MRLSAQLRAELGKFRLAADFDLAWEGVTAIFGASGSGKTTLLRAIAGLEPLARGRLAVDGIEWQDDDRGIFLPAPRRQVGFVFQDARLFRHLSVRKNLLYGFRRTPPSDRRLEPERVIDLLGLDPLLDRRTWTLSGGETQRVANGRSLLASPRLLLMDEPLVSLDARRKHEILPFLERVTHEIDLPILYVSHAIEEVLRLASNMALVHDGRVVAVGPVEEVASRLDVPLTIELLDAGTVLVTTVEEHDERYALTRLGFAGGDLWVPHVEAKPGSTIRVRIRSRDVALSLERPRSLSVLNVLAGTVLEVRDEGHSDVHVRVDVGQPIWARVTRRAADALEIRPASAVFALVKAVAVEAPIA